MYDWISREIQRVRRRCRTNFGGYWELDHSSYEGDLGKLKANQVNWWFQIIDTINRFIKQRQDEKKNK